MMWPRLVTAPHGVESVDSEPDFAGGWGQFLPRGSMTLQILMEDSQPRNLSITSQPQTQAHHLRKTTAASVFSAGKTEPLQFQNLQNPSKIPTVFFIKLDFFSRFQEEGLLLFRINPSQMGIMDQYFGNGTDELVVPKDLELLEKVESPDIWFQWGMNPSESFGSMNKYFIMETETAGEELKFNGKSLCNETDKETSVYDGDRSSGLSGGGFTDASLHRSTFSRDRPYFQLDDLAGIDQMDTIFLTSLLEDLPNTENFDRTFCFSPESQHGAVPENNHMEDMILDSQSISSNLYRMGSSKYLKTHAFSPSVGWDSEEVTTLYPNTCDSMQEDCPPVKAPMIKFLVPSGPNKVEEHVHEEMSLEESVLHELEVVMAQIPEKTRICFRDALYRLAKNSDRLSVPPIQNGDLALENLHPLTVNDETLRSGKTAAAESETNSIDRAVANLLFNKMDFNPQDLPTSSLVNFEQEDMMTMDSCNYSLNQPETHYHSHPTLGQADVEDDEVPIFSQEKLQTKAEVHEDFPINGAVDHKNLG